MSKLNSIPDWHAICDLNSLTPNTSVCALVNGQQLAIYRVSNAGETSFYATSNWDPVGKANVIYRGIIGSIGDEPVIASPLYKQRFSLLTGECFESPEHKLSTYPVKIEDNRLLVQI